MKDKKILRGDMFYANLGRGIGSEQKATDQFLLFKMMSVTNSVLQ